MGNCILMVSLLLAYLFEKGLSTDDFSILNNGDDCLLFVRGPFAGVDQGIPEFYARMGFVMKMEQPCYEMETIEFCQTHPVYDGEKWRMVRNFPSSLSKDSLFQVDVSNPSTYVRMLGALGECGMALCHGIPVLQSYYAAFTKYGRGTIWHPTMKGGLFELRGNLGPAVHDKITMQARLSFMKAFGIPVPMQYEMERYYDTVDLRWGGVGATGAPAPVHLF